MKIYTNTIDLANLAPRQFWVAPYSDFGIGIKFVNGKNAVEGEVILQDEFGNELPAEAEKHGDGFTVFKTTSLGLNVDIDYFAIAPNGQRAMVTQNVTNSTVSEVNVGSGGIDIGEGGEINLTNYYTKTQVDAKLDTKQPKGNYALQSELTGFYTKSEVDTQLATKQPKGNYLVANDLTGYYTTSQVDAKLATKQPVGNYVVQSDLTSYYTKTQVDTQLAGKQPVGNYIINDGDVTKIKSITQSDYDALATKDANTLYVIVE